MKEINNAIELQNIVEEKFDKRKIRHTHYTKLESANKILSDKEISFLMSPLTELNDKFEELAFDDPQFVYELSFVADYDENVTLWYMYGDRCNGCSISLTKHKIDVIQTKSVFSLCKLDKDNNIIDEIPLTKDDIHIDINFVVYYTKSNTGEIIVYIVGKKYKIPEKEFEKYKKTNKGFVKSVIWKDEREIRIICSISDAVKEKIKKDSDNIYKLRMVCADKEVLRHLNVKLGPNHRFLTEDFLNKYNNLNSFNEKFEGIILSDYKGQVILKKGGK